MRTSRNRMKLFSILFRPVQVGSLGVLLAERIFSSIESVEGKANHGQ